MKTLDFCHGKMPFVGSFHIHNRYIKVTLCHLLMGGWWGEVSQGRLYLVVHLMSTCEELILCYHPGVGNKVHFSPVSCFWAHPCLEISHTVNSIKTHGLCTYCLPLLTITVTPLKHMNTFFCSILRIFLLCIEQKNDRLYKALSP